MPAPALNPWDQLSPQQQLSLITNLKAGLPSTGGAAAPASPMAQRMGGAPMPPGWPGAGQPFTAIPPNQNMGAQPMPQQPLPPVRDYAAPQPAAAPAGLPLYLPKQTIQEKRAAEPPLAVPYAPGHGPWDMEETPHATTAPGGGKNPKDYDGQKDAGNPNGGLPPTSGKDPAQARGQLADFFGIPGMGMMNPRSMFKPAAMAPRGTAPVNPLQAAGSPQSALPGGAPSLGDLGKDPSKIALGQQAALTTAMPELHNQNYLQPIDPMTMKGEKSQGEASQEQGSQSKLTQAISDPAFATALARVLGGTPGLDMMRQDVGQLADVTRDRLAGEKNLGPVGQLDLSPLMALSDTWFGGDLSKGYHAPIDRLAKVAEIAKGLHQGESALSQHEIEFLKANLQDQLMNNFATKLGGSREVQVGMGGGAGGMLNPLEMMRFMAEQAHRGFEEQHTTAAEAGKYADKAGEHYADLNSAFDGIDALAKKYDAYNKNYLPGYGGKLPLVGKYAQNLHNPLLLGQSDDGKQLQMYLNQIKTAVNNIDFGSRVTNVEMRQQAANLASQQGMGPKQLMQALKQLENNMRTKLQGHYGTMTPEARAAAAQSGAILPEKLNHSFGIGETPAAPAPKPATPATAPAPRAGAQAAPKPATPPAPAPGKKTTIIDEGSKDVDELVKQAKERSRAFGGK